MAYRNDPRVRVLKKYGILIDADPEELASLPGRLPPASGEAHIPKELLEAEVDDLEETLQPSVKALFASKLESLDEDVSVEQLLQEMLRFMNSAAADFAKTAGCPGPRDAGLTLRKRHGLCITLKVGDAANEPP